MKTKLKKNKDYGFKNEIKKKLIKELRIKIRNQNIEG